MSEKILNSAISSNVTNIRPYFDDYKQYLVYEKADILQANEDFFRAISERDLPLMKSLWVVSNQTVCKRIDQSVILSGFEDIMNDWEKSFKSLAKVTASTNATLVFQVRSDKN